MQVLKPKREYLISLRKSKKLSQGDLASRFSITREFYSMIEHNKRNPNLELAKEIAIFFNVSVEEIF